MCGIYGMVSLDGSNLRRPDLAPRLAHALKHRGPDGVGEQTDQDAILGATRLRIVDRRDTGNQPFVGPGGTVVVCNGEVYNAGEIRNRHPTYRYRSKTDVEPLVPLLETHGPTALTWLDGMFAIAAWNRETRTLLLVRDRAGEKPLFYAQFGHEVWFASEIQALREHPDKSCSLDSAAIADYLALGYVREPKTLHPEIRKIPAGTVVTFTANGSTSSPLDQRTDKTTTVHSARPDRLRSLLQSAVIKQMHADVPVGVFTSGGLDSSLVTAFATQVQPGVHTFTARFTDSSYDEGLFARAVAAHFRSRHHEVVVNPKTLTEALEIVTARVAEPISDPAVLPTTLLSRVARQHVGAVLSGEGADEFFGGYPTYIGHQWADTVTRLPSPILASIRQTLTRKAASSKRVPMAMLLDRFLSHSADDTHRRHVSWFGTGLLRYLPRDWQDHVLGGLPTHIDPVLAAMEMDVSGYLREGLLTKLDRASMLWSLETRAPFLDKYVVAYARSLPRHEKVAGRKLKIALAEAAHGVVPSWIIRRRKRGLSVPIGSWINNELRTTVGRLLEPKRIANQTFMPELPVARLLAEHQQGRANHSRALWALIVLQLWLEKREGSDLV